MSEAQSRNASLDSLRALAILAVFVHHLHPGIADVGDRGVDLFFVLSGYLIGSILLASYERGRMSLRSFWRDRWLRTLPAYYAALAAYVVKELLTGGDVVGMFSSYAAFMQSYVYAPGSLPKFHHSWSLCVEEHFYLVLPLILALLGKLYRQSWVMPVVLAIGIGLLIARTILIEQGADVQIKLTHWRTDALILGVLLAKLNRTPRFREMLVRRRHALALVTVGVLLLAGWVELSFNRHFQLPVALACGCLVMLGIAKYPALEIPGRTRAVAWIARISYSFYLVHPLVLMEVEKRHLPERFGSFVGWPLAIGVSLVLTLAASQLLYTFVERPGLAIRERLRARARASSRGSRT